MAAVASLVLLGVTLVCLEVLLRRAPGADLLLAPAKDDKVLTGVRGLAAFAVLIAHLLDQVADVYTQRYCASAGVVVFFMLTGHLFFGMAFRGRLNLRDYPEKRVRRLVPAAFVAITAIQIADWIEAGFQPIDQARLVAILKNYTFGFEGDYFGVTGVHDLHSLFHKLAMVWTLEYEWLFYLVFPFVAYVAGRSLWKVFAVTLVFGVVFIHPPMLINGDSEGSHFFAFFLGAVSAWLSSGDRDLPEWFWEACLVIWLFGTGLYIRTFGADFLGSGRVSFQLLVALFFIPLVQLGRRGLAPIDWFFSLRSVQVLGVTSYSLYLWHMVVIHYGMKIARLWLDGQDALLVAALPITLVTLVISALSYLRVERPFMVRGRETATVSAPAS